MAVKGLDRIRDAFSGYEDCYTIIGGTACDILLSEQNMNFRATKDIDMIILVEDRFDEFARVFWSFIKEGGYKCGWKQSADLHFYRFTEPNAGCPVQIELFSRKPDYHLESQQTIIPIHIGDDVSSLSAILLDDDYYNFMLRGRETVNGISILKAEYLIPFKMYAWLNLTEEKTKGNHVNSKDLNKHKNDVFRLLQIVPGDVHVSTSGAVEKSIREFLVKIVDEDIRFRDLGIEADMDEQISRLRELYDLQQ